MVWQEKVPTIVMLTSLREGPNRKCQRYWPEFGTAVYGPYQVTLKEQQVLANYILSTLEVTVSYVTAAFTIHVYICTEYVIVGMCIH